jgi:hypothetical protein
MFEHNTPDVTDNIRKFLDQAGYKDVNVSQDRDNCVVTLTDNVPTDADRSQSESNAKANADAQVVADQISVRPPGNASAGESHQETYVHRNSKKYNEVIRSKR